VDSIMCCRTLSAALASSAESGSSTSTIASGSSSGSTSTFRRAMESHSPEGVVSIKKKAEAVSHCVMSVCVGVNMVQ
jgi:hypothetical protein